MNTATAHIDISRPAGLRLAREVEKHNKVARVDYPLPAGISGKGISLEEMKTRVNNKLSEHYGIDFGTL